jgi:Phytanoyl-CoA dioxygenase (PhyH)
MTAVSLSQFFGCGYQILPGIIDRETIKRIRDFLEDAAAEAMDEIRKSIQFDSVDDLIERIDELQRKGRIESLDPEMSKLLSGHLPLARRLDPILWTAAQTPRMQDLLGQLFPGARLHMHMPPAARYVLPKNRHAMVPAHQDVTYNKHMGDFVTVWVPFVPIDASCGGVAVYPETHRSPELVESGRKGFWHEPIAREDQNAVACEVPLGGVLLLSNTIIHESMSNRSDRTRYSVDYRFFGDGTSYKHYLRLDTMELVEPGSKSGPRP